MACVTLKRPLEVLGSPHMMEHEPMAKKRCGVSLFQTTPPGSGSRVFLSGTRSCGRSSPGPSQRHSICDSPMSSSVRASKRVKRKLDLDQYSDQYSSPSTPLVSPFESATPCLETGWFIEGREVCGLNFFCSEYCIYLEFFLQILYWSLDL